MLKELLQQRKLTRTRLQLIETALGLALEGDYEVSKSRQYLFIYSPVSGIGVTLRVDNGFLWDNVAFFSVTERGEEVLNITEKVTLLFKHPLKRKVRGAFFNGKKTILAIASGKYTHVVKTVDKYMEDTVKSTSYLEQVRQKIDEQTSED